MGTCSGESAKAQPLEAPETAHRGDGPVELVADKDAVPDEVEGLSGHPLVVDGHGGQPVGGGAVTGDVHDLGAVAQGPQLVEGGEGGPGVGRLVSHGPVQLGGVPDRLVDGEPQVGGVDDQVVAVGLDRRRRDLLGQQLGDRRQLGLPVPPLAQQVLPAPTDRRGHGPHGLEAAIVVEGDGLDDRVDPDPPLGGLGPGQVGVVLVLGHGQDLGGDVVDGTGGQQPPAPVGQELDLVGQRDGDRIDVVGSDPVDDTVPGLRRQLHRTATGAGR